MLSPQKEKKIVRFVMMMLFGALFLVYLLFFQVREGSLSNIPNIDGESNFSGLALLETQSPTSTTLTGTQSGEKSVTGSVTGFPNLLSGNKSGTGVKTGTVVTNANQPQPSLKPLDNVTSTGIKILSGSVLSFKMPETFDRLDVEPEYVLVLPKEQIYLGYFGVEVINWRPIVRSLKGNTVAFSTEKDMVFHQLPGERAEFINLPEYKGKYVIIALTIQRHQWLVHVPTTIWHKSKPLIKKSLEEVVY